MRANTMGIDLPRKPYRYATPTMIRRGAEITEAGESRMLPLPAVMYRVGVSRTAIYEWMGRGMFPKPVKLGPRRVAWRSTDIEAWLAEREAA